MEKLRFLDIEDLYLLVHLSEGLQVTEIAKCMHVTQPAISQRLIKINGGLGFRVHANTKGVVSITDKGKLLADAAKSCLEILEKAIC
jgi:DNA-binding transcriptional LysR family regulator